ncbi:MAG TPA: type II secretion system protein GspE [Lentisphaeria bacterium]|nr:MAG: type II secretion system protein GspE [Lentisphaerae bacterium GWF2_38_69]HBM14735.1 type II secretion system protein GspE [Lentisphaeria bacterium]
MSSNLENSAYILTVLLDNQIINEEQLELARQLASKSNGELNIISALKKLRFVDDTKILSVVAREYGMDTVDLTSMKIEQSILDQIPLNIVKEYKIIPLGYDADILKVAIADPTDIETIDSLRFILKKDIEGVVAPRDQINRMIDHYYGSLDESVDSFLKDIDGSDKIESTINNPFKEEEEANAEDAPIIKLVSLIIVEAFKRRASDIHIEPLEKRFRVRYRIDGVLVEVDSPPKYLQANIISRMKIMAKLDIAEKRLPQDGRIQLKILEKNIDLRVSSVPTSHGESIVMRILDKTSIMLDISTLGYFPDDADLVNKIINMPDGIFLVTGPTGSGKTTSLYAFLNAVNKSTRKIITAEDPVEYQLEGINQVQVNSSIGLTFAAVLRAMVRQAPNIIMVGEIRDGETAEIAINAALTGHFVLSTLHTNDAPSAITRLIDIGVKPFLVASSVRAIMAQRLVRRICSACSEDYIPNETEIKLMGVEPDAIKKATFKKGKGCTECNNTGFKGRFGIIELFMLTEDLQELIFKGASSFQIKEAARKAGMKTLREDGVRKVMAGMTTIEEVVRVSIGNEEE